MIRGGTHGAHRFRLNHARVAALSGDHRLVGAD